jgi:DNA polymerase-4
MSAWQRIILHADMDAFFAAVEQLDHPWLRGRPVLVGSPSGRGVVCTASYEARPFGVGSAMPMVEARRRCPGAIVVEPRGERYAAISETVMETFARFSPLVEPLSLDEAFLDLTGCLGSNEAPATAGERLRAAVREATGGLTVSVGIAPSKYVAKVASDHRKPDGLTVVPPGQVEAFLHPLPITRLWGVGPRGAERLRALGLHTIGDVAGVPADELAASLGHLGAHISSLARGSDPREVVATREARSVGAEMTLATDIEGPEAVLPHLRRVADRVARRLRASQLLAGAVRVKLKTSSFRLRSRQCRLIAPADGAETLLRAGRALLREFPYDEPMRLVGLAAFDLRGGGGVEQQLLFGGDERQQQRRVDQVLDRVHDRFGREALRRGSDLDHPHGSARP